MSSRYQREIEEILEKVNDDPEQRVVTKSPRLKSAVKKPLMSKGVRRQRSISRPSSNSQKLMVLGVLGLVLGVFLNGIDIMIAPFVLWGSILLLATSYATYFIRKSTRIEKRWRGEIIDDSDAKGPGILVGLWRRFRPY